MLSGWSKLLFSSCSIALFACLVMLSASTGGAPVSRLGKLSSAASIVTAVSLDSSSDCLG